MEKKHLRRWREFSIIFNDCVEQDKNKNYKNEKGLSMLKSVYKSNFNRNVYVIKNRTKIIKIHVFQVGVPSVGQHTELYFKTRQKSYKIREMI